MATDKNNPHTDDYCQPSHEPFFAATQAIRRHSNGGNILIGATVMALIVANIPWISQVYFNFWKEEIALQIGSFNIFSHSGHPMTVLQFINDALMAIFFFSIGLEIKREVLVGELSSIKKAMLPILAAIGGMVIPVFLYVLLSSGTEYVDGAAIPMATDIAFSLGILAMFGKRVPVGLKIFLTTLAVVDDIGGIIVIAAFYSTHIEFTFLLVAAGLLVVLFLGNRMRIQSKIFYLTVGGVVWFLFLNSGVHPTIAGVLVAFCIPATPVFAPRKYLESIREAINHFNRRDDSTLEKCTVLNKQQINWLKVIESSSDKVISPLQELEDSLHPIVNNVIVPLFAFANAGIALAGYSLSDVVDGISLSIIIGLVFGKFAGILGFSWLAVKLRIAPVPESVTWKMMAAVSVLGGIGFTVSLFIANLTFSDSGTSELLNQAKLGIVVGSFMAGIIGFVLLDRFLPKASAGNNQL